MHTELTRIHTHTHTHNAEGEPPTHTYARQSARTRAQTHTHTHTHVGSTLTTYTVLAIEGLTEQATSLWTREREASYQPAEIANPLARCSVTEKDRRQSIQTADPCQTLVWRSSLHNTATLSLYRPDIE